MAQTGSLSMEIEEEGSDVPVDISGLCRMCACTCPEGSDGSLSLALHSSLREKLHEYFDIQIEDDDDCLPKQICPQCYDAINQWTAILETVKRSEEFFLRQMEVRNSQFNVKMEPATMEEEHEDGAQYECNICHEIFANLQYLEIHQKSHSQRVPIHTRRRYSSRSNKYDNSLEAKEDAERLQQTPPLKRTSSIILPTPSASIVVTPIMEEFSQIDTTSYPCGKCQLTFESFDGFAEHTQGHSYLREIPCGICGSYFRNKQLLLQHVLEHRTNPDKQVAFTCDICNNVYSSRKNLLAHFAYRHSTKTKVKNPKYPPGSNVTFTCGTCKQVFSGLNDFAEHFPKQHPVFYELSCGVCNARFKRLPKLLNHEQQHKTNPGVDISYRCTYCVKVFSEARNLAHHVQVKHSDKPMIKQQGTQKIDAVVESKIDNVDSNAYICGACKVVYPDLPDFARHFSQVHPIITHIPCGVCGVMFRKVQCLLQHEQLHRKLPDEQVTFPCEYCEKKFSATRNLQQHMTKYHPECDFIVPNRDPIRELVPILKPLDSDELRQSQSMYQELQGPSREGFTCNECNAVFYNQTLFNKHSLKHVLNRCPCCQVGFERRRQLTCHMKEFHPNYQNNGKTLPCPVCGKLFKAPQTLKVHIELHSSERNYVCEVCAKSYRSLSTLYKHRQSHSDKPKFTCEFCQRTFSFKAAMKKHIMLHVNYLPFKCNQCGKRFTGLGLLKTHRIKTHDEGTPHHCIRCRKGFKDSRNWRRHMRTVCRVPLEEIPYVRDRQFIKHTYYSPTPKSSH